MIISPWGVSLVLMLAYNGAANQTKAAIADVLSLSELGDDAVNSGYRNLLETARATGDPAVRLAIANALWARKGAALRREFVRQSHTYYQAEVKTLDFEDAPKSAAEIINAWTSQNTEGKIPKIIDDADPNTLLMLTDAVYFKGKWALPFDKSETTSRRFFLSDGRSVTTPMMARSDEYPYLETNTFQAIRLDYGNGRFAMYLFLPRTHDGVSNPAAFSAFIKALDQAHWSQWTSMMSEQHGRIIMPRFELRYGADLRGALETLGLRSIFSPAADFSRIPVSSVPLTVSSFVHETYLKVDEEGATAAAASAMSMVAGAFPHHEPPPFELVIDHPFFCAIAETKTNTLLFAGGINDPEH